MRSFRPLFVVFVLLSLLGCSTAEVEKYIYKEGATAAGVSTEKTYWGEVIYKKGEYEFFPRFYTLSRSYSDPSSLLVIYSSSRSEIYLKNITIESAKRTYTDTIEFERMVSLDKFSEEHKSNYVSLSLFSSENTVLSEYWREGDIRVVLKYIDGAESINEIAFEFMLWKGREIVWPT